jgi:hypothetical protein
MGKGKDKCKGLRDKEKKAFKKYQKAEKTEERRLARAREVCGYHAEACLPEPTFDEAECNRLLDICYGAYEAWKDSKHWMNLTRLKMQRVIVSTKRRAGEKNDDNSPRTPGLR